MMGIVFEVPGIPQGKQRPKFSAVGRRVIAYTPRKTREYEEKIREAYRETTAGGILSYPEGTPLTVHIIATFSVPQSWSKKKKQEALDGKIRPTVRPDEDNILKVVQDALNKVAYYDDAQIVEGTVKKVYGENPGLTVSVYEVK